MISEIFILYRDISKFNIKKKNMKKLTLLSQKSGKINFSQIHNFLAVMVKLLAHDERNNTICKYVE